MASIIGASWPDQSRIFAPGMNKDNSCKDYVRSNVQNDVGEADKLDATLAGYLTNEWNTASLRIEESTPKSIFRKVIKQLDSSDWMNFINSLSVQTPDLVSFRNLTIQTDNVGDRRSGGVATRIANKDGIWKPTLSTIETAATHGDIKTISEKLAYHKFIKDSEFETSKVFEQENIEERENIKDIETRLRMTRIDDQKMENIEERKNIKDIETRLRMTQIDKQKMENVEERENINDIETRLEMNRSEHISTPNCENHGPKVNSELDPSSSDSSDSSSSDSAPKKKK